MKKLIMTAFAFAFAALAWADRTANREWVQRNFAPTNLVPRVEALESGAGQSETDPVFGAWKGGSTVVIGQGSESDGATSVVIGKGAYAAEKDSVVIGTGADAQCQEAVAIGKGAYAHGWGAVQIGAGENEDDGTLQFMDWPLVDGEGYVPKGRLHYAVPRSSHKNWSGPYACIDVDAIALFGDNATFQSQPIAVFEYSYIYNETFSVDAEDFKAGDGLRFGVNFSDRTVSFDGGETRFVFPELSDETGTVATQEDLAYRLDGKTVAIGQDAACGLVGGVAVGYKAEALAEYAVQLGRGTNTVAKTLQFREWPLVDANGKIPSDRLAPANVLTAIKGMNSTQLAELKAFLGIGQ